MAEPKHIVKASEAVRPVKPAAAPKAETPKVQTFRFVKMHSPCEVLHFADGSSFTFPLIRRNDGVGYLPGSELFTTDEVLAGKLRELVGNPARGIIEVTVKKG